jgi:hypothetical protein
MPNEATLASILPTLSNPLVYARGVASNLAEWKATKGSTFLRLAEQVRGLPPEYRFEIESGQPGGRPWFIPRLQWYVARTPTVEAISPAPAALEQSRNGRERA